MPEQPRRFDDLVRTVGEMRRSLAALQSTVLNRLSTHTHTVLGTVDPAYSTGKPRVTVDGASALTDPLDRLGSYTPVAGDRVALTVVGGTYVVLGRLV